MKLDPLVAQIIIAVNFNHFTTSDVRSAYLALSNDPSLEPSNLRRKMYAELLKLVKKGWLKKLTPTKRGFTSFSKTKLFNVEKIKSNIDPELTTPTRKMSDRDNQLLEKLNHYKAELLLNNGEFEVYKELYSDFPELIDEIQPKYFKAKDDNKIILGKIRAVESLISQSSS